MAGQPQHFDRISPVIIMIQSWQDALVFRGFDLIDKDCSWNEFCFMMQLRPRRSLLSLETAAKVGLIGDELLATR